MQDKSCINKDLKDNVIINRKCNHKIIIAEPDKEVNTKANAKLTDSIHKEFADIFLAIQCFKSTFSLEIKAGVKPYQIPLRHVAYTLPRPTHAWLLALIDTSLGNHNLKLGKKPIISNHICFPIW